jgi:hypothetical protein
MDKHCNGKTLTLQLFAGPRQKFLHLPALAYLSNRRYIAGLAPWRTVSLRLLLMRVCHSPWIRLSAVDQALRHRPMGQGAGAEISEMYPSQLINPVGSEWVASLAQSEK